jgi:hypothetical protein
MNMDNAITRRGFGQWIGGTLAAGAALAGQAEQTPSTITAAQIVDRIKAKLAKEAWHGARPSSTASKWAIPA